MAKQSGSKRSAPDSDPRNSQRSRRHSVAKDTPKEPFPVAKETPKEPFPVGTPVFKHFPLYGYYSGEVTEFDEETRYYRVKYPEDEDEEQLTHDELSTIVVPKPISIQSTLRLAPRVVAGGKDIVCLYKLHGIPVKSSKKSEFYLFLSERQRMWLRRRRGDTVLSASPIFRDRHWCNNYRELDRGTKYFHKHVLGIHETNPEKRLHKVLFKAYVYRIVNRVETFEETGIPDEGTLEEFFARGKVIADDKDRSFGSGAHQTSGFTAIKEAVLASVGRAPLPKKKKIFCDVVEDVLAAKSTEQCCEALMKLPSVSDFFSWQILCDLVESKCVKYSDEEYCMLGPGAKKGLDIIFGAQFNNNNALVYANKLVSHQKKEFEKLGIEFPYWRNQRLSIKEIEHALCEFSKYCGAVKNNKARRFKSQACYDTAEVPVCSEHANCCTVELRCDTCNTSAYHSREQPRSETFWQCANCLTLEKENPISTSL